MPDKSAAKMEEGWCKGTNQDKYRSNLFHVMKIAQNRYLRRKAEVSHEAAGRASQQQLFKDYQDLLALKDKNYMSPKNIVSIEEDKRRVLVKKSSCMGKTLQRYFDFNNNNDFLYYGKVNDDKPKKELDVDPMECTIQTKQMLNNTELKTWTDKDAKNKYRLEIMVPKSKPKPNSTKKVKKRAVYFYTDDLFEAEYLKLEIEIKLRKSIALHIHTANMIYKTNICQNLRHQMERVPHRKNDYAEIAAVCETVPHTFEDAMRIFGQRLVDKAKDMMGPTNKWLFDCLNLHQDVDQGRHANVSLKQGQILLAEDGMSFIDAGSGREKFRIDDYDSLHAVVSDKSKHGYDVNLYGRKMAALSKDDADIQDPMEVL